MNNNFNAFGYVGNLSPKEDSKGASVRNFGLSQKWLIQSFDLDISEKGHQTVIKFEKDGAIQTEYMSKPTRVYVDDSSYEEDQLVTEELQQAFAKEFHEKYTAHLLRLVSVVTNREMEEVSSKYLQFYNGPGGKTQDPLFAFAEKYVKQAIDKKLLVDLFFTYPYSPNKKGDKWLGIYNHKAMHGHSVAPHIEGEWEEVISDSGALSYQNEDGETHPWFSRTSWFMTKTPYTKPAEKNAAQESWSSATDLDAQDVTNVFKTETEEESKDSSLDDTW